MKKLSLCTVNIIVMIVTLFSMPLIAKEITVKIYKKKFIPAEITIEKGDTVIWVNKEKRQYHNVWFKQLDKEEPDYLFPLETFTKSFNNEGDFPYECGPHPKMKGLITVQ